MVKTKLLLLLGVFLQPLLASAQSATENGPPSGPPISPLPDLISFTKVFQYAPPKPLSPTASPTEKLLAAFNAQTPKIQRLDVVKTGDVRRDLIHTTDGLDQENFRQGALIFTTNSREPREIYIASPGAGEPADADFPELSWVTAAAYQGERILQGQKVFVYKVVDKAGEKEAEIDAKTRLPLHARTPELEVWYTYRPTPTEKLVLPDNFAKKLQSYQNAWRGGPVAP